MPTRLKVLLVDDHALVRRGFRRMLEDEPSFQVVGEASDGAEALKRAEELRPDVIVLDIAMPRLNGLDAARQLKRVMPTVKMIFLTVSEDPDLAAEAFRVGASGFLLKNSAASELFQAIQEVLQGRSYVTPQATRGLVGTFLHPPEPKKRTRELSPRQREVLQLVAEGHSMKEIGRILKIRPRTVAFHKYSMMEELGIKSTAELVQFAVKQHVVSV